MKPILLADAIAEVPPGSEPAVTPFEHKVKWYSYWEILRDVKEGRIVTPADEALAMINQASWDDLGGCAVCHVGFYEDHSEDCVWVDASRKVAGLGEQ